MQWYLYDVDATAVDWSKHLPGGIHDVFNQNRADLQ
jgi:hypothetical protein